MALLFGRTNYTAILNAPGDDGWKQGGVPEQVLWRVFKEAGVKVAEVTRKPVWPKACLVDSWGLRHCHKPKLIDMAKPKASGSKKSNKSKRTGRSG